MPTLSTFYGILIQMFGQDHGPSHFHALYAEHDALIDIRSLDILEGSLPRRALALVREWAEQHRAELMEDWDYAPADSRRRRSSRCDNPDRTAIDAVAGSRGCRAG
jgi:hypothetical protein